MKLSEIRTLLDQRNIRLTKSLGQNFLHDANQLQRIVKAAELGPRDRVLEIGPGLGPLTELLVAHAAEVLAIEKDARLVEVLRGRLNSKFKIQNVCVPPTPLERDSKWELVHDDALDYIRREVRDWSDWKLVANLPYSVASPILVELAQAEHCPQRLVATLQLEVAKRIVARAGDADYGVLSLLLQLRYESHGHFKIPPNCFFPAPDVDSACVTLVRRERELLPRELHATFEKIVKRAFSQRRKMMFKLLKQDWPEDKLIAAFEQLGLSLQIRAEKITLEQFSHLTSLLA